MKVLMGHKAPTTRSYHYRGIKASTTNPMHYVIYKCTCGVESVPAVPDPIMLCVHFSFFFGCAQESENKGPTGA